MTEPQELVTKLLAEGAKEFPHQNDYVAGKTTSQSWRPQCVFCKQELRDNNEDDDCPELLRIALDLTRQQLAEALDPTVREE